MLDRITAILREYKQDENLAITGTSTFSELGLDSLDIVELVMHIEEEFGVSIETSENVRSIGDLLAIIESQK